jgi:hypothetical protein
LKETLGLPALITLAVRAQAGEGGVEVVVLTMPEICEAIEAIYTLVVTVRLIPEGNYYDAAAETIRAELGISPTAMRMQLRRNLTVMGGVRERAQIGILLRLYEAARADVAEVA